MELIIRLPWPDEGLWPNRARRLHWAEKAKLAKQAKNDGYNATLEALGQRRPLGEIADYIAFNFVRPDRHRYDTAEAFSACKAAIDGICIALKIDDSQFNSITLNKRITVTPYPYITVILDVLQ